MTEIGEGVGPEPEDGGEPPPKQTDDDKRVTVRVSLFFDGTGNNRVNTTQRLQATEIYKTHGKQDNSYANDYSNVWRLEENVGDTAADYDDAPCACVAVPVIAFEPALGWTMHRSWICAVPAGQCTSHPTRHSALANDGRTAIQFEFVTTRTRPPSRGPLVPALRASHNPIAGSAQDALGRQTASRLYAKTQNTLRTIAARSTRKRS